MLALQAKQPVRSKSRLVIQFIVGQVRIMLPQCDAACDDPVDVALDDFDGLGRTHAPPNATIDEFCSGPFQHTPNLVHGIRRHFGQAVLVFEPTQRDNRYPCVLRKPGLVEPQQRTCGPDLGRGDQHERIYVICRQGQQGGTGLAAFERYLL